MFADVLRRPVLADVWVAVGRVRRLRASGRVFPADTLAVFVVKFSAELVGDDAGEVAGDVGLGVVAIGEVVGTVVRLAARQLELERLAVGQDRNNDSAMVWELGVGKIVH